MSDRLEPILRKVCLALIVILAVRVAFALFRPNPLAHLRIPELPFLASDRTNAPATNSLPTAATAGRTATNLAAGTNAVTGTNAFAATNVLAGTNLLTGTNTLAGTNVMAGTNAVAGTKPGATNPAVATTNALAARPTGPPGLPPGMMPPGMPPGMMMPGMMGRGGPGKPPAPLSTLAQARLDRVIQSELLGPVQRPLPMALLGIAGTNAFLRGTNGQTAMIGEGGDVGGLKLLRIGTNRVLVEDAGTKKELTIFNGEGGTSLLTP